MYHKFFVYLEDGDRDGANVFKIAIAAPSEEAARRFCDGNGDVVAVKDVTDEYPIDASRVFSALEAAGFSLYERDFICRTLTQLGVAD